MAMRYVAFVVCLTALSAVSCGRQSTPTNTVAVTPRVPPEPAVTYPCEIESTRTVKLGDGTELLIWELKMSGLKQLTVKLLIAMDGKVQTANEIEYKWEAWGADASAATGQLVLLVQNGKAFGAKDKRLPQMGLALQGAPPHSMTGKNSSLFLTGDLQSRISTASQKQTLGKRNLVYAQLFTPKNKLDSGASLSSEPDQLAAASKDGRTVLAVELSWTGP